MHNEVKTYCEYIKAKFPQYFKNKNVLDVGSLDINGNNRYLFDDCEYTGIDLGEGPNVDIVCDITVPDAPEILGTYDVVVSTEMLEHCKYYENAIQNMWNVLEKGGLLLLTSAGEGRPEHGTFNSDPQSAPFTNNHYRNILKSDFIESFYLDDMFSEYDVSTINNDIRFYGIKK